LVGGTGRRLKRLFALALVMAMMAVMVRPEPRMAAYMACVLGVLAALAGISSYAPAGKVLSFRVSKQPTLLLAGSLFFAGTLSEAILRVLFESQFAYAEDERSLLYEYEPMLGWFPTADTTRRFTGSRTIQVRHNSEGFRGPERVENGRPAIVFLGDSFVWGYDIEEEERFTEKLQGKHPGWNVYNLGVSGYSTDQEYLLLAAFFDKYKPKVVVLVVCTDNDLVDNTSNMIGARYYKPVFGIKTNGAVELYGVPVPRSERVLLAEHKILKRVYLFRLITRVYCRIRNPPAMHSPYDLSFALIRRIRWHVEEKGAYFAVGIQESAPILEQHLQKDGTPYVLLATTNRYATYGRHWTPEGHTVVCERFDAFLRGRVSEESLTPLPVKPPP